VDITADETREHSTSDEDKAQQTIKRSNQNSVAAGVTLPTNSCSRLQNHVKRAEQHGSYVKSNKRAVNKGHGKPSLVDEPVVLAVKLPLGQRIEHQFLSTHRLSDVLDHVRVVTQQEFTGCEFVSADRRTVLTDLDLTIAACGIPSRSVLYLHLPDET